jgi:hypothetical protein
MQTLIIGQILVGVVLLRHAIIHLQEVSDCEFMSYLETNLNSLQHIVHDQPNIVPHSLMGKI